MYVRLHVYLPSCRSALGACSEPCPSAFAAGTESAVSGYRLCKCGWCKWLSGGDVMMYMIGWWCKLLGGDDVMMYMVGWRPTSWWEWLGDDVILRITGWWICKDGCDLVKIDVYSLECLAKNDVNIIYLSKQKRPKEDLLNRSIC